MSAPSQVGLCCVRKNNPKQVREERNENWLKKVIVLKKVQVAENNVQKNTNK